jgi:hypothetical protein
VRNAHQEQQGKAKTWPQVHSSNLSNEAGNQAEITTNGTQVPQTEDTCHRLLDATVSSRI